MADTRTIHPFARHELSIDLAGDALLIEELVVVGEAVAARARELAPVGEHGLLKTPEGITSELGVDNGEPVVKVGWTTETLVEVREGSGIWLPYGYFDEFGTRYALPRPHLRPAADLTF